MSFSLLEPILGQFRKRSNVRGSAEPVHAEPKQAPCAHCRATEGLWPLEWSAKNRAHLCVACGELSSGEGRALSLCPLCTMPAEEEAGHPRCLRARSLVDSGMEGCATEGCAEEILEAARAHLGWIDRSDLAPYIAGVQRSLGASSGKVYFLDLGEPAILTLPGKSLLIGLGLLASLDDESQLAFLLARELAIDSAGWVSRRFGSAFVQRKSWAFRFGRAKNGAMQGAFDASLAFGYGTRVERAADREALASLIRADYDPHSAAAALRNLEGASMAGSGGRFLLAADRADWLDRSAESLGRTGSSRINREVYRRAVGGFAVFGDR